MAKGEDVVRVAGGFIAKIGIEPSKRRDGVSGWGSELSGDAKQRGDEMRLCNGIRLRHPPRSALANHINGFDPLQRPPRGGKRAVAFRQPNALFHRAMILFNHIIEVLALTQANSAREVAFRFQRFHRRWVGRVFVDVDYPGHEIARTAQGLSEEALGSRCVPFSGEQEINRLAGRIHGAIQILVLAFHLYIRLVGAVAFVGRLQMGAAALIQFRSIDLHPPPDATGVHFHAALRQQLGNVFVGEWISQVPPHAENDHLARELTSLERISWGDRH